MVTKMNWLIFLVVLLRYKTFTMLIFSTPEVGFCCGDTHHSKLHDCSENEKKNRFFKSYVTGSFCGVPVVKNVRKEKILQYLLINLGSSKQNLWSKHWIRLVLRTKTSGAFCSIRSISAWRKKNTRAFSEPQIDPGHSSPNFSVFFLQNSFLFKRKEL